MNHPRVAASLVERLRAFSGRRASAYGRRYPIGLQTKVASYARTRRRSRVSWAVIQSELGGLVSIATLQSWTGEKRPIPANARVRPIRITPTPQSRGVVLLIRLPSGTELQLDDLTPEACADAVALALLGSRRSR